MAFDLSEWWVVVTNGERFVGKRRQKDNGRYRLESIQKVEWPFGIVPDERGNSRPHVGVLTYPWFIDSLEIPDGALWISIEAMHNSDAWRSCIESTERVVLEQRVQRSGLHLPGKPRAH